MTDFHAVTAEVQHSSGVDVMWKVKTMKPEVQGSLTNESTRQKRYEDGNEDPETEM